VFAALMVTQSCAPNAEGWKFLRTKDGTSVYCKKMAGTKFIAYKGVGTVNAPAQFAGMVSLDCVLFVVSSFSISFYCCMIF